MANQGLQLWDAALDVDFVRRQICPPDIDDQEFRWFITLANQWRLNPLAKEIYITKYGKGAKAKAQIFAGLAGFQKIANRSGKLDGSRTSTRRLEEPLAIEYTNWENGTPVKRTYSRAYQYIGRAVVHKKGCAHPFVVEMQESEYSTGRDLWASKPQTMIKKVALCQALRMAFSISGLYDRDELGDDAPDLPTIETQAPTRPQLAAAPAEPIIEGTAREVAAPVARRPSAAREAAAQRNMPQQPDPLMAARHQFTRAAEAAGYTDATDRQAWVTEQVKHTRFSTLTAADWDRLARDVAADPMATWEQPAALAPMTDAEDGEAT